MNQYDSYLKKHLEKLNRNLYVSKDDPNYYDKLYRYSNQSTPELHYHLGKKYEEEGYFAKALNHYQKSAQYFHSPYYAKSKKAINSIEDELNNIKPINTSPIKQKRIPAYAKATAVLVLLLFVCVLGFLLGFEPVSRAISSFQDLNHDTEVIYDNDIIPFVFSFEPAIDMEEVEAQLHKAVMDLSEEYPSQTVFLYGIITSDKKLHNEVNALEQQKQIDNAFVLAEYNSSIDDAVRIRYLPNRKYLDQNFALNYVAVNLVRTALMSYIEDNGAAPEDIIELVQDYPNNYLSFIPNEILSQSNQVYTEWNGNGGWVFNKQSNTISEMFYPNTSDKRVIPFNEVKVSINKASHLLKVHSDPYLIKQKKIGSGRGDLTPEGRYQIINRVINPKGQEPNAYGVAGIGIGEELAIHGSSENVPITEQQSLGCIRLTNQDILEVFDFIPKGGEVTITNYEEEQKEYRQISNIDDLIPSNIIKNIQSTTEVFNWAS
ncbi:murein L,D-transpeptidase [Filobacillus milosensis]|uniref:Murein L,D-transpeptidase n=1 Tax=Filobacillus milosensis TaxID=94137 RepID=A0A4Y8IBY4_9BACI|nr:L,D-transpeptidase [Filobacillus milosensis]TFB13479.1 murein L,D-transpeptidase [Filobacillus milosensis]